MTQRSTLLHDLLKKSLTLPCAGISTLETNLFFFFSGGSPFKIQNPWFTLGGEIYSLFSKMMGKARVLVKWTQYLCLAERRW